MKHGAIDDKGGRDNAPKEEGKKKKRGVRKLEKPFEMVQGQADLKDTGRGLYP